MYATGDEAFSTPGGQGALTIDPQQQAASWASRMRSMQPTDSALYERHVMTNYPNMWQLMAPYMSAGAVDMRPMPEQRAPRRDNAPI